MPTVLRIDGFRIAIYTNDHRPSHVHVLGEGKEAVFLLGCTSETLTLREQAGFREHEVNRLERLLWKHVADLCSAWRSIHGEP